MIPSSSPTLSFAIMGVPQRLPWIKSMLSLLPSQTTLCIDNKHTGCWPNNRASWSSFDRSCSHHIVLQDDLRLPINFHASLLKIIALHPTNCISLWGGQTQLPNFKKARSVNSAFFSRNYGGTCQAIILPSSKILSFLKFADHYVKESCIHDDVRLRLWIYDSQISIFNTVPELVSHIGWNSTESRSQNYPMYQDADCIDFSTDPLDIDWTRWSDSCSSSGEPSDMDIKYLKVNVSKRKNKKTAGELQ